MKYAGKLILEIHCFHLNSFKWVVYNLSFLFSFLNFR